MRLPFIKTGQEFTWKSMWLLVGVISVIVMLMLGITFKFILKSPSEELSKSTEATKVALAICAGSTATFDQFTPTFERELAIRCGAILAGYVQGHMLTMGVRDMLEGKKSDSRLSLWCIPGEVDEAQLVQNFAGWANQNTKVLAQLINQYKDKIFLLSAITIARSFSDTYTCKKPSQAVPPIDPKAPPSKFSV